MSTLSEKRWRKRLRLYEFQGGKCFWCNGEMILVKGHIEPQPANLATLEHLDDRLDPARGSFVGERRVVLACYRCNQKRRRYGLAGNTGFTNKITVVFKEDRGRGATRRADPG